MAAPFLGQIISVGFDFAPVGWLPCDGRMLPLDQYTDLYSLIGTTYGSGAGTFALPNLNGRVPLGTGQGPGLSTYNQGDLVGSEAVGLISSNTPLHTHTLSFSAKVATAKSPKPAAGAKPLAVGANAQAALKDGLYASGVTANRALLAGTVTPVQGGQPHENRQPFQVLNYIIATAGIYPQQ